MPTLEELMAEVLDTPSQVQTKVASTKSAATDEIDRVLEGLGLSDGDAVKTASENLNETGGNMSGSLTELLYGELLGEPAAAAAETTVEKVASEETEGSVSGLEAFGEATGHYFNAAIESYFDKVGGDLEAEGAHDSAQPMAHMHSGSALGKSMGLDHKDPHVAVNHKDGLKHEAIHATTKNHGAYDESLKEKAAILSRIKGQGQVGTKKV